MSGIVHTPQRFKNWTPKWSSVLSVVGHPDFFGPLCKGSSFLFLGAPSCRNCCPANSQPMANGSEENLSGHPHSGGSGCMIVTFCQQKIKLQISFAPWTNTR
ncbi:hypothetical protein B0H14DRAFT_2602465 [Mycena olivaceomarginata]|nr:hypothetical protein B0H14DRAFT_2602465 [Mycena olivaceomarginata]